MAERLPSIENTQEDSNELREEALTQQERLRKDHERAVERSKETELSEETARENLDKVLENEQASVKEKVVKAAEREPKRQLRTKKSLDASFKIQMKDARSGMSAPARTFSKLIHNKAVEKTSEAIGSTIARPNAILAGSITAFILTAGFYFWAKYVGYPLSGFETIGAFIIGWLIGIIFDYARIMVTGKS